MFEQPHHYELPPGHLHCAGPGGKGDAHPLNPAHRASPPKREASDPNYFQMEEVAKILKALEAEPIKWRAAVHLLLVSGCRRGAAGPQVGPRQLGERANPH